MVSLPWRDDVTSFFTRPFAEVFFTWPSLESPLLDPLLESSSLDPPRSLLYSTLYWSLLHLTLFGVFSTGPSPESFSLDPPRSLLYPTLYWSLLHPPWSLLYSTLYWSLLHLTLPGVSFTRLSAGVSFVWLRLSGVVRTSVQGTALLFLFAPFNGVIGRVVRKRTRNSWGRSPHPQKWGGGAVVQTTDPWAADVLQFYLFHVSYCMPYWKCFRSIITSFFFGFDTTWRR
jgi:hypothetical protein